MTQSTARALRTWLGLALLVIPAAAAGAAHPAYAAGLDRPSRLAQGAPSRGDIADNAVYLRYHGHGFAVEYVEGWLRTAAPRGATFSDKDSRVVVDLRPRLKGSLAAYVQHVDLPRLMRATGFRRGTITNESVAGRRALRLTYAGRSAPDDVTGKTVALQVERYYVDGPRALGVITLSTPVGVDNVDAFRRIAHSFRFE
ncbi:MAG: hypothetical protein NVSMB65_11830 [Chloroflexota bacterium]